MIFVQTGHFQAQELKIRKISKLGLSIRKNNLYSAKMLKITKILGVSKTVFGKQRQIHKQLFIQWLDQM